MATTATANRRARTRVGTRLLAVVATVAASAGLAYLAANSDLPQRLLGDDATAQIATTVAPVAREALVSGRPTPVSTTDPARRDAVATETTTPPTVATSTPTPSVLPRLDIDPVFDSVHDRLAEELTLAVRLPSRIGEHANEWTATLTTLDADGYVVHLGVGDACNGASLCRAATFTARRSNRLRPTIPGQGTPVPLPDGLSGVFSDSTCGADCTNGFITWVEGDVLYSVGSRLASGPEVLRLAWNAIDSSQAPPEPPEICGPGAPADTGRVSRPITTEIDDGRSIHWLLVCSGDGTHVEIVRDFGDLRWSDVDADGFNDLVLTAPDGSSVIFAVGANAPRAAIDTSTSSRLVVGELGCKNDRNGVRQAFDLRTDERLDFVNPVTVRRTGVEATSLAGIGPC